MKYVFKKKILKAVIPIFDILGGIVFSPIRCMCKKIPPDPKKILIVRLDHIGDFVCTTPLFKNLKKHYPCSQITALVNSVSKELAFRDPNIDKVITFSPSHLARNGESSTIKGLVRIIKDIKNIGFDLGIDPRGDLFSILIMWLGGVKYRVGYGITGGGFLLDRECKYDKSKHIIERNLALLEALDISVTDKSPEVYFNEKDKEAVERLLSGKWDGPAIVLHPFAGAKAKEWPEGNFQKLINKLKENGRSVLLVGSKDDHGTFENVIDLRGEVNLAQLAYLIKRTGYFIGLDSGPANIAAALGIPAIIICSGTNIPQLWIPNNPNVKLVYKDTECRPCENKVCPNERHECMDRITVEEVMDAVENLINLRGYLR